MQRVRSPARRLLPHAGGAAVRSCWRAGEIADASVPSLLTDAVDPRVGHVARTLGEVGMSQRQWQQHRISAAVRGVVERLESRRLLAVGPDGYGYVADTHPFENIDLVVGAPGVQVNSM